MLARTGRGLLVAVAVETVEAVEAVRSSGTRAEPVELVGDDRPSLFADPPGGGGEGKGKDEAATVLWEGRIAVGVNACSRGENERERVRVRIDGLLRCPTLEPAPDSAASASP
jgi:hypothetical protein